MDYYYREKIEGGLAVNYGPNQEIYIGFNSGSNCQLVKIGPAVEFNPKTNGGLTHKGDISFTRAFIDPLARNIDFVLEMTDKEAIELHDSLKLSVFNGKG